MDNSQKLLGTTTAVAEARDPAAFDGVSTVKPYRVDPFGNLSNLPENGMTPEQLEIKKGRIRSGAELMTEFPVFPTNRRMHDKAGHVIWLFMVAVVAFVWYRYVHTNTDEMFVREMEVSGLVPGSPNFITMMSGAGFAALASTVLTCMFFVGYMVAPTCMVWLSLLLFPCLKIVAGVGLLMWAHVLDAPPDAVLPLTLAGSFLVCMGVAIVLLVICCYKKNVPLTVKVLETTSKISVSKPGMFLIASIAGILCVCWYAACIVAVVGFRVANQVFHTDDASDKAVTCTMVLFLIFGFQILRNTCHVAVCGVFGRWYHGIDGNGALRQGLTVSFFHSFGSIVFGSLMVAVIRVIESYAGQLEGEGARSGNCVQVVLGCVIRQIIKCIGDIVEFFNEWAFVQVAIRGVSFVEAVRITWGLCTCANLQFIITGLLTDQVLGFATVLTTFLSTFAAVWGAMFQADIPFVGENGQMQDVFGPVMFAGVFVGLFISGAILSIINSGAKTILVSWAENPEPLKRWHPELHDNFESRIMSLM